jgi:hypothetical protein
MGLRAVDVAGNTKGSPPGIDKRPMPMPTGWAEEFGVHQRRPSTLSSPMWCHGWSGRVQRAFITGPHDCTGNAAGTGGITATGAAI